MSRLRALIASLAFAAALPAHAGLFSDDEARASINKLRDDFSALSQHVDDLAKHNDTLTKGQLDFANQLQSLQTEIAKIRGQLEVMTYDIDTAQKRQKDFYVDLDNRLRKLEQLSAVQAEQQKAAAAAATEAANETRDYEAALSAFKAAKYKDAASGFLAFIKTYPNSTMQPSAHFWAGAALRQQRQFKEAAELFGQVAGQWPADGKAADALLAQADCLQDAGDPRGARAVLQSLASKYPDSSAGETAKRRLGAKKKR